MEMSIRPLLSGFWSAVTSRGQLIYCMGVEAEDILGLFELSKEDAKVILSVMNTLLFQSLSRTNSGPYTCTGTNLAAFVQATILLDVYCEHEWCVFLHAPCAMYVLSM